MSTPETFGQRVRRIRTEKGITQTKVAAAIGTSVAFVCDIEHDRRMTDRIDLLAAALDIDPQELHRLDFRPAARIAALERRVADLERLASTLNRRTFGMVRLG